MIFRRFLKLVLWRESEPPPSIIWRRRKILFIIMNVFLIPILMSYGICVLYVMMWLVVHPLDGHPPRSWLAVSALPTFFAQIMRQIQPNYSFVLILFLLIRKEGSSFGGFRNGAEICAKAISWLSAILHDVTFWVDYWRIIMLFWVMRDVGFCCGLLCWLILLCENSAFVVNRVLIASVFDLPLPQNFKGGFSCRSRS